jgi:hypothetical protein
MRLQKLDRLERFKRIWVTLPLSLGKRVITKAHKIKYIPDRSRQALSKWGLVINRNVVSTNGQIDISCLISTRICRAPPVVQSLLVDASASSGARDSPQQRSKRLDPAQEQRSWRGGSAEAIEIPRVPPVVEDYDACQRKFDMGIDWEKNSKWRMRMGPTWGQRCAPSMQRAARASTESPDARATSKSDRKSMMKWH